MLLNGWNKRRSDLTTWYECGCNGETYRGILGGWVGHYLTGVTLRKNGKIEISIHSCFNEFNNGVMTVREKWSKEILKICF